MVLRAKTEVKTR